MDFDINSRIDIFLGDITSVSCDAVVNAANSSLSGGGGVDGAIHKAAGRKLYERCSEIIKEIGTLKPGEAVITPAYEMKTASNIIHTVGPFWKGGNFKEREVLSSCYENSLKIAADKKFDRVAFPAISTGVYFYPYKEAFDAAYETVNRFLKKNEFPKKVIFVFYEKSAFEYAKNKTGL